MRPSTKAWVGLGIGVAAYDTFCPPQETMSEGVDTALERHPLITYLAIGAVALHLVNKLPQKIDPLHQIVRVIHIRGEPISD